MPVILAKRKHVYEELRIPWQRVAFACRFESVKVAEHMVAVLTDEFEDIHKSLTRG